MVLCIRATVASCLLSLFRTRAFIYLCEMSCSFPYFISRSIGVLLVRQGSISSIAKTSRYAKLFELKRFRFSIAIGSGRMNRFQEWTRPVDVGWSAPLTHEMAFLENGSLFKAVLSSRPVGCQHQPRPLAGNGDEDISSFEV